MNALLDGVRARSPCAIRVVRAYSTMLRGIIHRHTVAGRNFNIPNMRRDLDDGAVYSGGGNGNERGRPKFGYQQVQGNRMRGLGGGMRGGGPASGQDRNKYNMFGALIDTRFTYMLNDLGRWNPDNYSMRALGLHSQSDLDHQAKLFRQALAQSVQLASSQRRVSQADNPLFWSLRNAFVRHDTVGLSKELRYAFQSFVMRPTISPAVHKLQEALADFRQPHEWFPATRTMQRTIHLHVGPTNSGKTYHALQALMNAKTGIYAGPLRLLAHEIYSRFMAKGQPCALITGEEQRYPTVDGSPTDPFDPNSAVADTYFQSCTVEMTPLNKRVDVAVIDEIQMISDPDRGWAWTQAFLGVQAREVHLCGEERTVDLIKALCARIGDKCHVHKYKRLSELQTMNRSLQGDLRSLQKGDAVVAFSRVDLHTLKRGIEEATGRRCAIVYGSLPPETRAQQAALFNDPDNDYDFLVASDAIGMGLNLEIKRVIFEKIDKHDGITFRHLTVPEVKQIGGRAGRYRTAASAMKKDVAAASAGDDSTQSTEGIDVTDGAETIGAAEQQKSVGYVTTLEDEDLHHVRESFNTEAPPLKKAGIQAPTFAIEQFARYFPPGTPFSYIISRLRELSQVSGLFQLCNPKDTIEICDIIQPFPMTVYDRCIFLVAPVSLRDPGQAQVLQAFARCVSEMRGGELLDIPEVNLEVLDVENINEYPGGPSKYLVAIEALHKTITLYLWLSYRFSGVFTSQQLAFHVKSLVEAKIESYLDKLTFVPERRQQRAKAVRKLAERQAQRATKKEKMLEAAAKDEGEGEGEGKGKDAETEGAEEEVIGTSAVAA